MSAAASPAELTEQPQDKGSTAAKFSLHPYLRRNWLKWVHTYDTVPEGAGLKEIHPFLIDKNS